MQPCSTHSGAGEGVGSGGGNISTNMDSENGLGAEENRSSLPIQS